MIDYILGVLTLIGMLVAMIFAIIVSFAPFIAGIVVSTVAQLNGVLTNEADRRGFKVVGWGYFAYLIAIILIVPLFR